MTRKSKQTWSLPSWEVKVSGDVNNKKAGYGDPTRRVSHGGKLLQYNSTGTSDCNPRSFLLIQPWFGWTLFVESLHPKGLIYLVSFEKTAHSRVTCVQTWLISCRVLPASEILTNQRSANSNHHKYRDQNSSFLRYSNLPCFITLCFEIWSRASVWKCDWTWALGPTLAQNPHSNNFPEPKPLNPQAQTLQ